MALIDKLTAIADAIREKTGKKEALTLDEMVREITEISTGDTSIEDGLITGALTEYSNDRVTSVGVYAFTFNGKIKSVKFPLATNIELGAFYACRNLTKVDLPIVTQAGDYAFFQCSSLTNIDLPALEIFNTYAFSDCLKLKTVCLRNETKIVTLVAVNIFSSTPIASGTGYIYVPSALLESYKVATNWVKYADQFRALEDYTVDGTATGELDANKI